MQTTTHTTQPQEKRESDTDQKQIASQNEQTRVEQARAHLQSALGFVSEFRRTRETAALSKAAVALDGFMMQKVPLSKVYVNSAGQPRGDVFITKAAAALAVQLYEATNDRFEDYLSGQFAVAVHNLAKENKEFLVKDIVMVLAERGRNSLTGGHPLGSVARHLKDDIYKRRVSAGARRLIKNFDPLVFKAVAREGREL